MFSNTMRENTFGAWIANIITNFVEGVISPLYFCMPSFRILFYLHRIFLKEPTGRDLLHFFKYDSRCMTSLLRHAVFIILLGSIMSYCAMKYMHSYMYSCVYSCMYSYMYSCMFLCSVGAGECRLSWVG